MVHFSPEFNNVASRNGHLNRDCLTTRQFAAGQLLNPPVFCKQQESLFREVIQLLEEQPRSIRNLRGFRSA